MWLLFEFVGFFPLMSYPFVLAEDRKLLGWIVVVFWFCFGLDFLVCFSKPGFLWHWADVGHNCSYA